MKNPPLKTASYLTIALFVVLIVSGCIADEESAAPPISWDTAKIINNNIAQFASGKQEYDVAFYGKGEAIVVWLQSEIIFTSRYSPNSGWETPEVVTENVSTENFLDIHFKKNQKPEVAVDKEGNAIVVWVSNIPKYDYPTGITYTFRTYARRLNIEGDWGNEEEISSNSGNTAIPKIAMDSMGNASVTWFQGNCGCGNIVQSIYYDTNLGWGQTKVINFATNQQYSQSPDDLLFDLNDKAFLVGGTRYSQMDENFNWETSKTISTEMSEFSEVSLSMDGNGNIFAIWKALIPRLSTSAVQILSSRFEPGVGWSENDILNAGRDRVVSSDPRIATNKNGDAVAIWRQKDNVDKAIFHEARIARFIAGEGWQQSKSLAKLDKDLLTADVAIDSEGNIAAIWNTSSKMFSRQYVKDVGWSSSTLVYEEENETISGLSVEIDNMNNFVIFWQLGSDLFSSNVVNNKN